MNVKEFAKMIGIKISKEETLKVIYDAALNGSNDSGGLCYYSFLGGEPNMGIENYCDLFIRTINSNFNFNNFCRVQIYSMLAPFKLGMDILLNQEKVVLRYISVHGGFFKVRDFSPQIISSVLNVPVTLLETAGEGGAWGIAILAEYSRCKVDNESLSKYLELKVFAKTQKCFVEPNLYQNRGFEQFLKMYIQKLDMNKM